LHTGEDAPRERERERARAGERERERERERKRKWERAREKGLNTGEHISAQYETLSY
jgi:hypothetical protein